MAKKSKDKESKPAKPSSKNLKIPGPVTGEVPPLAESAQLKKDKAGAPKRPIGSKPAAKEDAGSKSALFKSQEEPAPEPPAAKPAKGKSGTQPLSDADIALRAYFIAEKRRNAMLPGDEHQDWTEAERQLQAESAPAKFRGRTSGKS